MSGRSHNNDCKDIKRVAIRCVRVALCMFGVLAVTLFLLTSLSVKPMTKLPGDISADSYQVRIMDRNGIPLNMSYRNRWNRSDHVSLYDVPELLTAAFIASEDKRFFDHCGIDWRSRFSALNQNIRSRRAVRGASTITEQVVRMVNPRPRTIWSRWIEGFEATRLERSASKAEILEFYLNQVPYAANRRGVVQAARYYFNRDLSTLSPKEMLALAVLVRAPSAYDLYRHPERIETPLMRLAASMKDTGVLDEKEYNSLAGKNLKTGSASLPVEARHFVRYLGRLPLVQNDSIHQTTLDSSLQRQVQDIIDHRLKALADKNVNNAAAIVADYQTGEILAWVVGGSTGEGEETPAGEIDTVTTPRQPGSALKPFLYARALDKGWTAAKILDDSPLTEAVGSGLHNFRNYSNTYYGPVTVRESLGNSLNIPALLTIRHVGAGDYLTVLQKLGFESLALSSGIYDEGLALGNGEVTLLEMAQAYAALANKGIYKPFHFLLQDDRPVPPVPVYSADSASLIGSILSDPWARRLEFGSGSVLNLPSQTAAKTGTSTDYRDAWTMAYNDRYVVGLWMGNLDNTPMKGITGSTGPALALRGIFSILNLYRETQSLYFSPRLIARDICIRPRDKDGFCPVHTEWFTPETVPEDTDVAVLQKSSIELVRPTEGLQIAYDPRIPAEHQKFRFEVRGAEEGSDISWVLNDRELGHGQMPYILWPIERGRHSLSVKVQSQAGDDQSPSPVGFIVK